MLPTFHGIHMVFIASSAGKACRDIPLGSLISSSNADILSLDRSNAKPSTETSGRS
jgi:hypothetical protein